MIEAANYLVAGGCDCEETDECFRVGERGVSVRRHFVAEKSVVE